MNNFHIAANLLEKYLQKPSNQFTIDDIINYVFEKEIEMINFRYVADDEKLKTINFVVTGKAELENLLKYGERVNGNSVFTYNNDENPDLYVIPNFNTAFLNPFTTIPTLDILCSFYTWEGEELQSTPENILRKATEVFKIETGYDIKLFGELEYYVISNITDGYSSNEGNYQNSEPFSKFEKIRVEAIQIIAQCGGRVRFAHAEHGSFSIDNKFYEQHEIEFLPSDAEEAIRQLIIAKWILRMLGQKYNVDISFSPKVAMDKPGNGLHLHFILEKDGNNILGEGREFRKSALQIISGILKHAKSLTAFGNTIPVSYLRLSDTQKASKYICWGPSNRSALLRIPKINMKAVNDIGKNSNRNQFQPLYNYNQSIEYRGIDASAYLYFFVSAFLVAGIDGLSDESYFDEMKTKLVSENLHLDEHWVVRERLEKLPDSCNAAANELLKEKILYTRKFPIFPDSVIDFLINKLKNYNPKWINEEEENQIDDSKNSNMIQHFFHYR